MAALELHLCDTNDGPGERSSGLSLVRHLRYIRDMASLARQPYYRVSVDEFLAMDLGAVKAELDDGVVVMLAGGTEIHARIAGNIFLALGNGLRGTSCRPYGSDMAVRSGERSVRFPDVSVYCRPYPNVHPEQRLIGDPRVAIEVLSPSTATLDLRDKLAEYQTLDGLDAIVFVDPAGERIRLVERMANRGWTDRWLAADEPLTLVALTLTIGRDEIFAD